MVVVGVRVSCPAPGLRSAVVTRQGVVFRACYVTCTVQPRPRRRPPPASLRPRVARQKYTPRWRARLLPSLGEHACSPLWMPHFLARLRLTTPGRVCGPPILWEQRTENKSHSTVLAPCSHGTPTEAPLPSGRHQLQRTHSPPSRVRSLSSLSHLASRFSLSRHPPSLVNSAPALHRLHLGRLWIHSTGPGTGPCSGAHSSAGSSGCLDTAWSSTTRSPSCGRLPLRLSCSGTWTKTRMGLRGRPFCRS